jgi:predicted Zn-dependent protease with MMP-like domain
MNGGLKLKKLLVLILTLIIAVSLVACGGVDKTAVTEAFNNTNTEVKAVAALVNDNLDKMNQSTADELNVILNAMAAFKSEIESEDMTQERADKIIAELKNYPAKIAEVKSKIEALIESGGGVTEEQAATLTQLAQSLTDVQAKYAEYYDILNDETKDLVDEIAITVNDINSILDGSTEISIGQADQVIEGVQDFLGAVETGWAEIEAQLPK